MRSQFSRANLQRMVLVCIASAVLIACAQDDAKPTVNPAIEFRTDSGYTYLNDTLGMEDTVLVGVTITKGDDALQTFKVLSSYDAGATTTVDSLRLDADTFVFEKTIITRPVTGSEKWTFWVQEHDGDVYKRSLTFTVQ